MVLLVYSLSILRMHISCLCVTSELSCCVGSDHQHDIIPIIITKHRGIITIHPTKYHTNASGGVWDIWMESSLHIVRHQVEYNAQTGIRRHSSGWQRSTPQCTSFAQGRNHCTHSYMDEDQPPQPGPIDQTCLRANLH